MDPDFKKILEKTFINNSSQTQLKQIKEYLKLNISYSKIKQILNLIYGNELKEIKQNGKIFFNVSCSKEPIRTINNIIFWELYNNYQIQTVYNNISELLNNFDINQKTKHKKKIKKTLKMVCDNIIYYCLCSGIPNNAIPQILFYTSTKANLKHIDFIYRQKRTAFKNYNNVCAFCGSPYNLELHHIEPQSTKPFLRYNLNNWLMLCSDCHKKQHNKEFKE